jgi:branched-chain amino acid aminotransferase
MSIRVHVGGQIVASQDARISVFDRGFLYGDSVYETVATVKGRLFALFEHLDRLEESAKRIGIVPPSRVEIEQAVTATVAAAGNAESRVRIIVSRGEGWGDLDPASATQPQLIVIVGPRGGPTAQMYADGVEIALVSVLRNDPRALDPAVKSGNYLNNVMAVAEARRRGAHEAILRTQSGGIAEGATSNVFVVREGRVQTPALSVGILNGVTRVHVLNLCHTQGIPVDEMDPLTPDQLRGADEIFLTSSVRGILPVTRVDGVDVKNRRPGVMTTRLMTLFRAMTEGLAGLPPEPGPGR